jgi:NADH dehydrogenase [ubiquinone] 1 alpha subcomplex assembly factor 5
LNRTDEVGEALYRDRDFERRTPLSAFRDAKPRSLYPDEPERIQASPSRLLADPKLSALRDQVEAIVSAGGLHWVGDIVGALTQVKHLLKPDGVFVGAVLGGDSLFE